jgi:hypothetical protein
MLSCRVYHVETRVEVVLLHSPPDEVAGGGSTLGALLGQGKLGGLM